MTRLGAQLVATLKRHLAGGKPSAPEAGVLLWNLFMEISASRTYHSAGPHPISHAEIEAFARIHRWPFQPHHVAIIRAMDDAWLEHAYRQTRTQDGGQSKHSSGQAISPEAFDAVFA